MRRGYSARDAVLDILSEHEVATIQFISSRSEFSYHGIRNALLNLVSENLVVEKVLDEKVDRPKFVTNVSGYRKTQHWTLANK